MSTSTIPILISGPTASGKTSLAIKIAKQLNGVIINADVIQFYKYLDIGSAKPTKDEQNVVPHLNYDLYDQKGTLTAIKFCELTKQTVVDVIAQGKQPIIVGGSGLYLSALLSGYTDFPLPDPAPLPAPATLPASPPAPHSSPYELLLLLDPERASALSPNDNYRIARALEIIHKTGSPVSHHYKTAPTVPGLACFVVIPVLSRNTLYQRIDQRVEQMFEDGLIAEVKQVLLTYPKDHIALKSIGYAQVIEYLNGNIDLEETTEKIKQLTRNYAKRQLTFWKNEPQKRGWETIPKDAVCFVAKDEMDEKDGREEWKTNKKERKGAIKELCGVNINLDQLIKLVKEEISTPFYKSKICYYAGPLRREREE